MVWIRRIIFSTLTVVEEHKRCFLCFFLNALKLAEFLGFINNAIHAINVSCFIDLLLKIFLFITTQIRKLADNILGSFFSSFKLLILLFFITILVIVNGLLNVRISLIFIRLSISLIKDILNTLLICSLINLFLVIFLLLRSQIRILIDSLLRILLHLLELISIRCWSCFLLLVANSNSEKLSTLGILKYH